MRKLSSEIFVSDWLHVRAMARYAQRLDASAEMPLLQQLIIRLGRADKPDAPESFVLSLVYWEGVDHVQSEFFESRIIGFREGLEVAHDGKCTSMGELEASWLQPQDIKRPTQPGENVIIKEPRAWAGIRRIYNEALEAALKEPCSFGRHHTTAAEMWGEATGRRANAIIADFIRLCDEMRCVREVVGFSAVPVDSISLNPPSALRVVIEFDCGHFHKTTLRGSDCCRSQAAVLRSWKTAICRTCLLAVSVSIPNLIAKTVGVDRATPGADSTAVIIHNPEPKSGVPNRTQEGQD